MDAIVTARGLIKRYHRGSQVIDAIAGVDLSVGKGEKVLVMGPSGGGKSTLLNLIGGLDRPDEGSLTVAGVDLGDASQRRLDRFRKEHVGFVFQFHNLLGTASARDNVALGLLARGRPWRTARSEALDLLDAVAMAERADHLPAELSGGEQQRVAVARALAGEPSLVLADEPTGDVDGAATEAIMTLFDDLNRERGVTFLIVTHDTGLARHAHRVLRLTDGRLDA